METDEGSHILDELGGARRPVPDEKNPYPSGSAEAQEWNAGAMSAYLEVLDGEE